MRAFSTLSDQQLVQLFVNGETEALDVLVNRHKVRIYVHLPAG